MDCEMSKSMQKEHARRIRVKTPKRASATAEVSVDEIECPIGKEDAAQILGICVDTLDGWTARYGIAHLEYDMDGNRGNRGKVMYLPSDLLAFRERYRVNGRDIERDVEQMLAAPLDPGPGEG